MLARRSFVLLLMWPLTLILGSLDTLQHTVLEEPHDYRARKQSQAEMGEHLLTSIYRNSSRCSQNAVVMIRTPSLHRAKCTSSDLRLWTCFTYCPGRAYISVITRHEALTELPA
jgi:hypothetical protein